MLLLAQLRRLQALVGIGEVGAGVLAIGVEEQIVQFARQIVVMGDVAAGTAGRVELFEAAEQPADAAEGSLHPALARAGAVAADQVEKIVERAVLDRQRAVHVRFAGAQSRLQQHAPMQRRLVQADGHRRRCLGAEDMAATAGVDHGQASGTNQRRQQTRQQHHFSLPAPRTPSALRPMSALPSRTPRRPDRQRGRRGDSPICKKTPHVAGAVKLPGSAGCAAGGRGRSCWRRRAWR